MHIGGQFHKPNSQITQIVFTDFQNNNRLVQSNPCGLWVRRSLLLTIHHAAWQNYSGWSDLIIWEAAPGEVWQLDTILLKYDRVCMQMSTVPPRASREATGRNTQAVPSDQIWTNAPFASQFCQLSSQDGSQSHGSLGVHGGTLKLLKPQHCHQRVLLTARHEHIDPLIAVRIQDNRNSADP